MIFLQRGIAKSVVPGGSDGKLKLCLEGALSACGGFFEKSWVGF
tara:strand:- start:174 stop:305 length:132 start_codon:yes stop_codon:yes gene_type:complete